MTEEDEEVTPAAKFRHLREQGVKKKLSGFGRVVRIRPPRLEVLLRAGRVPDILTPMMLRMIHAPLSNEEINEFLRERDNAKETLQQIDSLNIMCEEVLIEPRVVEVISDPATEITIHDLTYLERGWIFKWAMLPAEYLTFFRAGQEGDVESVQNGADDLQPSEQVDGRERPADSLPT